MDEILKEIEGTFDGENLLTKDGSIIFIPSNYASKSRLITGDEMSYRITRDGRSYFKQVNRVPTKSAVAAIVSKGTELMAETEVNKEWRKFKILDATKSFYKLKPGDEVVIKFPEDLPEGETFCVIENKL